MRSNNRPVIFASELPPNLISLSLRSCPIVACPECGVWRSLSRGMITAHRWPADTRSTERRYRCPGSGQCVRIDLTVAQWQANLRLAAIEASTRRGSRVVHQAAAPLPPAVPHLAAVT